METGEQDTVRKQVIKTFGADEEGGRPKTSVSQALSLMNGSLVTEAVNPATKSLPAFCSDVAINCA